ncbi:MAG TPA: ECF-type sigma factor [Pirellulaceae bacterium]|nr:ECF-type sigma factor [Pirellulaceae bacterium]
MILGSILIEMTDVTQIFSQIEQGDRSAAERLLPLVYDELRKLAAAKLAQEKPGQTLQATALVHEAYVRLVDGETEQQFNSRGHFFAAAAEAMRRILVEQFRRKNQVKHGGEYLRVELDAIEPETSGQQDGILALHESLNRLEAHDSLAASVVKLRYFAGLSMPEAAEALGIPLRTAERNWTYARTWLLRDLE